MQSSQAPDEVLAKSFDIALQQFLTAEGSQADTPDTRGRLAARLVVLATHGEQSEQRLAAEAVLYMRAFAAAMRIAGDKPLGNRVAPTRNIAVGPDAVIAMSQALNACIDELPEGGVSSTARQVLHEALLEAAADGQHDVNTLKHLALEKLRTRT